MRGLIRYRRIMYNKVTFMPFNKRISQLIAILLLSLPAFAATANPTLRKGHPERYRVREGDRLWDMAEQGVRARCLWPEIGCPTPGPHSPHLIYPGAVISLVYVDGRPRLTVQTGDR